MSPLEITLYGTIGLFLIGIICSTVEKCYYWKMKAENPDSFKHETPDKEKEKK